MLTCASPLRFVIRTDAIIAQPCTVSLPDRVLLRNRLTLTDRPAMHRMTLSSSARRLHNARRELASRPIAVADCRPVMASLQRSAAWHAFASLAVMLAVVALCALACIH